MDLENLLEKHKLQIGVGLAGAILLVLGLFFLRSDQPEIEIIPVTSTDNKILSGTIFVDIEGAVQNPGVYELPAGSILNDLLIRAGGLSAVADRDWAAKNINLAQKLVDGSKFFIIKKGSQAESNGGQIAGSQTAAKININTASLSQLDSLWGIGAARAQAIIDNRPYQIPEELLTRKVIPQNVYDRIKDGITVY